MRVVRWLLAVVAVVAVAAMGTLTLAPGAVVSATQWQAARSAGLSDRSIEIDGRAVHYFEGGTGPTMVFLHGMGDDRHSFVATAGAFTDTHRVILPDLRGHGDNAYDATLDHAIPGQRAHVAALVDALGLERFVLVGNSMGGHVSASYALARPETLEGLVLVNAPGLVVDDTVVYGGFGAPLAGPEDLDALMARVLYEPPSVPGPIKRHMVEATNARVDDVDAMARAVREGPEHDLSDRIGTLSVPTLVLWGEADVVVPFAVGEAYAARIPEAELVVLPEAGHSPQLEAADRVAAEIETWMAGL